MSFSTEIHKNNNLNKTCSHCGQKTVYYKKRLRETTIKTLQFINAYYSFAEFDSKKLKIDLYNLYTGPIATEMFKHYALAEHFGFLCKINKKWSLTYKGYQFLWGSISVPEYIYGNRNGHYSAEQLGMQPAPRLFIQDFVYHDESDATLHYEEALPIEQL